MIINKSAKPIATDTAIIGSDSLIMRTWEESHDIKTLSKRLQKSLDWCDLRAYIAILLLARGWSEKNNTICKPITSENISREVLSLNYIAEPQVA